MGDRISFQFSFEIHLIDPIGDWSLNQLSILIWDSSLDYEDWGYSNPPSTFNSHLRFIWVLLQGSGRDKIIFQFSFEIHLLFTIKHRKRIACCLSILIWDSSITPSSFLARKHALSILIWDSSQILSSTTMVHISSFNSHLRFICDKKRSWKSRCADLSILIWDSSL